MVVRLFEQNHVPIAAALHVHLKCLYYQEPVPSLISTILVQVEARRLTHTRASLTSVAAC